MHILIISSQTTTSKMQKNPTKKSWALLASIQPSKIHVDSTMSKTFAKIGTIPVIVLLEIVACIFMIDQMSKLDGNFRGISSSSSVSVGEESTTLNWRRKKIDRNC